jgi:diguanylate cyclase (GGDEF)-like protein/PAS domain S-box-containing protein
MDVEAYHSLLAHLPIAAYRRGIGSPVAIEFISDAIQALTGFPASTLIQNRSHPCTSLIHAQDQVYVARKLEYAITAKQPYDLAYRIVRADGSVGWVRDQGYPSEQWIDGMISAIEPPQPAALHLPKPSQSSQSLTKLQEILNSPIASISYCRILANQDWAYEYCSPGCEAIFGFTPEELIADKNLWTAGVLPEDLETKIGPTFADIFAERSTTIEYRFRHRDGSLRWISASFTSEWDHRRASWLVTAFNTDISQRKQAENIAIQSHQRLIFHIENTPLGVIEWDAQWRVQRWSVQAERIFGWQKEEVLGKRFSDWRFVHEQDQQQVDKTIDQLSQGQSNISRNRNYTKNGSVLDCEWYNSALLDDQGQILSILSLILDVSDRIQAERQLQAVNNQLQAVLDAVEGNIGWVDRDLNYLGGNRERQLNCNPEASSLLPVLPLSASPHPICDFLRRFYDSSAAAASEEMALPMDQGGVRDYLVNARKFNNDQSVVFSETDITDLKQTEKILKQQLAAFELAVEGIAVLNSEWEYTYLNTAHLKMFGYDHPEQLLGQSWRQLYYPHEVKRFEQLAFPSLQQNGTWQGEAIAKRQDNSTFAQEVSLALTDDQGLICICRDISQRKQSEVALQLQAARDQLLGAMTLRIRQSLQLSEILKVTVEEVQQSLHTDRVLIAHCRQGSNLVVAEAVAPGWLSFLGMSMQDPWFLERLDFYRQGHHEIVHDLSSQALSGDLYAWMEQWQIKSRLAVPILSNNKFWGIISIHQCAHIRDWKSHEIRLLEQLANQVAIAIQQAELYQQLKAANQKLAQLAYIDGLTQLANRRRFDEFLEQEWSRMMREKLPLTLILADIDHFKNFNDTFGHIAGDHCLQSVAQALRQTIRRAGDLVARYGGEEFAFILPNTSQEGAVSVVNAIQSCLGSLSIGQENRHITLSFGISTTIPDQHHSAISLIALADKALYQAKCGGRNCFVHLNPAGRK